MTLKFKRQSGVYVADTGTHSVTIEKQWDGWVGEIKDANGNTIFEDTYATYSSAKMFIDSEIQAI